MRLLFLIITTLILAGCEGHYRYPCQDPANWNKTECNNEVCAAEGACTENVTGRKPVLTPEEKSDSQEQVSEAEEQPSISTKQSRVDKVEDMQEEKQEIAAGNSELERDMIGFESAEQPVTMDTIVETTEHNEAIK
jgi:hypothetical protein